ncbi:hypothetical protein M501DRAFT_939716 [Patellaria atrata CBS 101060]|uniref:DNA helicase n=1 Tax=Patellaria atrata CBS 101060 TaxID=1346257 RepID=A0A9P4S560_9PEZI|nr:hypothetical protein M501DRAFT_939716 [Patellaria atrata CBS 101060]
MGSNTTYRSEDDSGDDLFNDYQHNTIPTQIIDQGSRLSNNQFRSQISSPPTHITQPTQILASPNVRRSTPVVQVAASSPFTKSFTRSPGVRPSVGLAMAPPGTIYRPPPGVRHSSPAPNDADFSDDPPVHYSTSEDELSRADANIKPTKFSSGVQSTSTNYREHFNTMKSSWTYGAQDNKPNPRKRPGDDMANAYGNVSRPAKQLRQTGPARAQPVQDINLEQIPDWEIQQKVKRMKLIYPHKPLTFLRDALSRNHGNINDAIFYITEVDNRQLEAESSTELIDLTLLDEEPRRPSIAQKSSVKQLGSSPIRSASPESSSQKPKTRRRLVGKGRRGFSALPDPDPSPRKPPSQKLPIRSKQIIVPSDDDEAVSSASEPSPEELDTDAELGLLKFFNTCSERDFCDLSNQPKEIAQAFLSRRPFKSLDRVREISLDPPATDDKKKKRRNVPKRPLGDRIVDVCMEMWLGYQAVDGLVSRCEQLGKPLAAEMKKWGVDIFGASKDGELGLINLNEVHDSGIGTPVSSSETEGMSGLKVAHFIQKPVAMAENIQLKDYQIVGLNWLNLLWSKRLSCILADDMGLGKTCQVIAFLTHLAETGHSGPHLVIVPGSTLENWMREFSTFSPSLNVVAYYGKQAEREEQRTDMEEKRGEINVVVTTYDIAWKPEDNKFFRKKLKPTVCVYDEGHYLRNNETKRYRELMRIDAEFRLLLTGTPLQNNLQELASLLAFIMPNVFEECKEELSYIFRHKAKTTDADHAALLSAERIKRARSMMTPFVLRRKKDQVLKDLPKKTCRIEYCELTPSQKEIYDETFRVGQQALRDRAEGKPTKDHANVLMDLRKASISPLLFRRIYTDKMLKKLANLYLKHDAVSSENRTVQEVVDDMTWSSDFAIHQQCLGYPSLEVHQLQNEEWMDSGKVTKLVELLKTFKKNGDRALIFSQFTTVMDILEKVFETIDMPFFRMDGQTAMAERQDMFDAFYEDESIPVFMLSTKSGGAGINLACANKVIIFDSSFNPQDDIQAENRAHRVGQTRDVEVVRLITRGTIEEKILALGQSKLVLDERVAGEEGEKVENKGLKLVEEMMLEEMNGGKATDGKSSEDTTGSEKKSSSIGDDDDLDDADLGERFKKGLEDAGLDMSACEKQGRKTRSKSSR